MRSIETKRRISHTPSLQQGFLVLFVFGASKDLEQDEKEEAKAMFKSSLDDLMLLVLGSVFDVFGKSYLAFLFCADVTTEIIGCISQGDDR